jgi:thiol-disulfide isomerase/thioredoxin
MKVALIALVLCLSGLHAAHAQSGNSLTSNQGPSPAEKEAIDKADALLSEVARVYAAAPALTDAFTMKVQSPRTQDSIDVSSEFGPNDRARVHMMGSTLTSTGDHLYFTRDGLDKKYMTRETKGDVIAALEAVMRGGPPELYFRFAKDHAKLIQSLGLGMVSDVHLTGLKAGENGESVILFAGGNGTGTVSIDDHKLMHQITLKVTQPGTADVAFDVIATMNPKIVAELPQPIDFKTEGRTAVETMEDLKPDKLAVGDVAPDFTLPALSGEQVTLSKLQGSIVVLDFWATWCGPCQRGLPLLDEFTKWVKAENKPVKIYAVDVWQREKSDDEKTQAVSKLWTAKAFSMPTLLDHKSITGMLFGIDGIPFTVIIDAKGKVIAIHQSYDPKMVEMLKTDIEHALSETR